MLEPRRLAARAAAERIASELGEQVGDTVGYRIRLESRIGPIPGSRLSLKVGDLAGRLRSFSMMPAVFSPQIDRIFLKS